MARQSVHEQLAEFITGLECAGWQRKAGNVWESDAWRIKTSYVHGEVTVELSGDTYVGNALEGNPRRYYRGNDLATWCRTNAATVIRKIFGDVLDKVDAPV